MKAKWILAVVFVSVLLTFTARAQSGGEVSNRSERVREYSVEVQTAVRAEALSAARESLATESGVRIEETSEGFRLLIGRWHQKSAAEAVRGRLAEAFPRARVVQVITSPSRASSVVNPEAQEPVVQYDARAQGNVIIPEASFQQEWAAGERVERQETAARIHAEEEDLFWTLLRQGRYRELGQKMEALEARDPAWRAPADMKELLREGQVAHALSAAAEQGQWREVVDLARVHSEALSCRRFDNRWTLARAYIELGAPDRALEVYERALRDCTEAKARRMTLERGLAELPTPMARTLQARAPSIIGEGLATEGSYTYYLERLLAAHDAGRVDEVTALARVVAPGLITRRDSGVAQLLGWNSLERQDLAGARQWFERSLAWAKKGEGVDAAYGLILTHMRLKNHGAALQVARRYPEAPKILDVMDDILRGAASERFEAGSYAESLELLAEAEHYRRLDRPGQMMKAWCLYHLGRHEEAARLFEVLWETEGRDSAAALGFLSSLAAKKDWATLASVASEHQLDAPLPASPPASSPLSALSPTSSPAAGPAQPAEAGTAAAIATLVGWSHHHLGENAEAEHWFVRALSEDPGNEEAAYGLATSLVQQGRRDEAEQLARRYPESSALSRVLAEVLYGEARDAFDSGDYARSVAVLEEASRYQPATREQHLSRGWALLKMQQFEPADAVFTALYQEQPDAETARGLLYARSQQGDWEGVAAVLDSAPDDVARGLEQGSGEGEVSAEDESGLAVVIAWSYFHKEDFVEAARWFERALERAPQFEDAAYGLGLSLLRAGNAGRAQEIARQWPNSARIQGLQAELLMAGAQSNYDAGNYSAVLEALSSTARLRSLERPERMLQSWTLFRLGRIEDARQSFSQLFREQPDRESAEGILYAHARLEDWRGITTLVSRMPAGMVREWRSGTPSFPGDASEPAMVVAWAYFQQKEYFQAGDWFQSVLDRRADFEEAAYGLALSRTQRGDIQGSLSIVQAWPQSERMRELAADAYLAAARKSYETERFSEALRWVDEAAQYRTLDRPSRLLKGWILYRLGRVDEAAALFEDSFGAGSSPYGNNRYDGRRYDSAPPPPPAPSPYSAPPPRSSSPPPGPAVSGSSIYGTAPVGFDREVQAAFSSLEAGRVDEAAQGFEAIIARQSRHERARYGLALARMQQGRLEEAERLARSSPSTPELTELLARVLWQEAEALYEKEQYQEALTRLEESERFLSPGRDQLLLKAWCLYQLERYPEASRLFEQLYDGASLGPSEGEKLPSKPAGVNEKVARSRAREKAPGDLGRAASPPSFYLRKGGGARRAGAGKAERAALRMRDPQEGGSRTGQRSGRASEAAYGLAISRKDAGDLSGAEEIARQYPDDPRMRQLLAELRSSGGEEAAAAYEAGRYQETLRLLKQLEKRRTLTHQERLYRAWSLYYLERYEEAARCFQIIAKDEAEAGVPDLSPTPAFPDLPVTPPAERAPALPPREPVLEIRPPVGTARGDLPPFPWESTSPFSGSRTPPPSAGPGARAEVPTAVPGVWQPSGPPRTWPPPTSSYSGPPRSSGSADEDAGIALALAWIRFEQGSYLEAGQWFERVLSLKPGDPDALYGLALSYLRRGDVAGARDLARRYPQDPRMSQLLIDGLLGEAADAYNRQDYNGTLRALDEAAAFGPLPRDSRVLRAWALFNSRRVPEAARAFEDLYREGLDSQSAEGLYYSLNELRDYASLDRLGRELGGPLSRMQPPPQAVASVPPPLPSTYGGQPYPGARQPYEESRRYTYEERRAPRRPEVPPYQARSETEQGYFDSKLFLRAAALHGEDPSSPLSNIDSGSIALGGVLHSRSGLPGLDQLDLGIFPYLQGRFYVSPVDELELFIENVVMDSGTLPQQAPIGAYPIQPRRRVYQFAPTTRLDGGVAFRIRFRHEGRFSPYLEVGSTPTNGALDAAFVGRAGFGWQFSRGSVGVEAFRLPVRESLLSYTGLRDPYSGSLWGQVLRGGGRVTNYTQWGRSFGSYIEVIADTLTGERVAPNDHIGVRFALPYTWKPPRFDGISIGPYVFYDSYDLNLGAFTLGHGGYFSPQDFLEGGLALQFTTEEARRFTAYGRLALGFQAFQKDAVPVLPLVPDGRFYPAEDINGSVIVLNLKGLWQVAPRVQLGAGLGFAESPRYDYFSLSLLGRYLFRPRTAIFSTDLPGREIEYP